MSLRDLKKIGSRLAVLFFALGFSLFLLWMLFSQTNPSDSSSFLKIVVVLVLANSFFWSATIVGFILRTVFRRSFSTEENFKSAVRQGIQTGAFSLLLVILMTQGLLNGWVVVEFVLLLVAFDWYMETREKQLGGR